MYINRIEVSFDAGHRLLGYVGKCASPHGHTYKAEVFMEADAIDNVGFASDFIEVKSAVRGWIEDNWDHAFLVNDLDTELLDGLRRLPEARIFVFKAANPSCEVMAATLHTVARLALGDSVRSVRIWESATQYSEYTSSTD